jgi:hypothetical protein
MEEIYRDYFEWLYSQIARPNMRRKAHNHRYLTIQLHNKEFVWFVPNDDNRMQDGRDLRHEYAQERKLVGYLPTDWYHAPCSMLEMLVALARQLGFQTGDEPGVWFWHLIENLDLLKFNDAHYDERAERIIDHVLDRVISRTYGMSGAGGLFPLKHAQEDQREVELWRQLNAYLIELFG